MAQPADSRFEPRVPNDFGLRKYPTNSVVEREAAKDEGFVWVVLSETAEIIPACRLSERMPRRRVSAARRRSRAFSVVPWPKFDRRLPSRTGSERERPVHDRVETQRSRRRGLRSADEVTPRSATRDRRPTTRSSPLRSFATASVATSPSPATSLASKPTRWPPRFWPPCRRIASDAAAEMRRWHSGKGYYASPPLLRGPDRRRLLRTGESRRGERPWCDHREHLRSVLCKPEREGDFANQSDERIERENPISTHVEEAVGPSSRARTAHDTR